MADEAREELAVTLQNLLQTGDYSDFTITCGDAEFKVHKAIVCTRSDFFKRASRFNGKDVNKVDLSDVEGDVLKLLLQYLYQGEYDPRLTDGKRSKDAPVYNYTGDRKHGYSYNFPHSCEQEGFSKRYNRSCNERFLCSHHICGDDCRYDCKNFVCETCCPDFGTPTPAAGGDEQLLLHAKMYDIGDNYTVTGLQQLAREKFLRACVSCWDSEYFATAAQYAFTTTPDEDKGLRDLISNTISQHMVLLKKPAVEALLNEFNGLAVGLLKAHGKTLGWV